ncbi:uncharacterized protein LOC118396131 isoform X2 [Oncorhynchus keta]|uniref:uncharacterized protein LOC118396131 isoform X2 n=1 Tax=Oncorhynchus keta TaxID=8018 RepID=UPI00227A93EF|nr:uncharacterized protein LOC118396131 isoform X2 [Oncorhynchus keta]
MIFFAIFIFCLSKVVFADRGPSGERIRCEGDEQHRGEELKRARTEPAEAVKREGDPNRSRWLLDPDQRCCYECGEPGHLTWSYPGREGAMPSASPSSGVTRMASYVTSCWAHTETAPPMVPVRINGIDTSALLDSGSMVTLAYPQWLTREGKEEPGDKEALWRRDLGRCAREVGRKEKRTVACATQPPPQEVSTGPESNPEEGDDPAPASEPLGEEDLRLMEVEALDGPPDMGILTGQFGMAQLEDPNLQNARGQVMVDGVLLPGVGGPARQCQT